MANGRPVYDERDRLVILTPCYDWSCTTLWQASIDTCRLAPVAQFRLADGSIQVLPVVAGFRTLASESHIDRARNTLSWILEQDPWRFGLWFDADQELLPDHVRRLWLHLVHGHPVVGGCVAFKSVVPRFVTNRVPGAGPSAEGLVAVTEIGTGCLAFNREVLVRFRERWPEIAYITPPPSVYAGQQMHAYFASGVATEPDGRRNWLPEDWTFCRRCIDLGIPVLADVGVQVRHMGRYVFPAPPEEVIEAALAYCSGRQPPFDADLAAEARAALRRLHISINDDSITILHPTRRGAQALARREQWFARASSSKGIQHLIAFDADDAATREVMKMEPGIMVRDNPGGIVAAINEAAKFATGRILVMAADDCVPPQDWDRLIREALKGQLHLPRLLWTSDGYSDQPVITHPIMTRALYERQGWFFCPEYPHLFCDTELTERAVAAGEVIDARHIVLKHEHPMFTGAKPDELHQQRNSPGAWADGRAIFLRRNPTSKHPHVRA